MEEIKKQARDMFDAQVTPNISLNDPFQKMYTKLHLVPFIKNFIDSIIDLAVSKEQERVTSKTDEVWDLLCQMDTNIKSEKEYAKDIINLINTK